jgi:hypothetical protein
MPVMHDSVAAAVVSRPAETGTVARTGRVAHGRVERTRERMVRGTENLYRACPGTRRAGAEERSSRGNAA